MLIAPKQLHRFPWDSRILFWASGALALCTLAALIALAPLIWVAFAISGLVAAFFTLRFPWLPWLGFAFALPIAAGIRIGPASASDAILVAALAAWLAAMVVHCKRHTSNRIPIWPISVYIIALYLSTLGALNIGEALTEIVKWIEFALLLRVVPLVFPHGRAGWLVAALLAAAALQGIYGLYQFIFRIGPDWFIIQGRFMRASGVFGQPNPYGAYLGLTWPVALALTLASLVHLRQRPTAAHLAWLIFTTMSAVCIAGGLLASWSRGAWLGAVASTCVVFATYNRRTAILLACGTLFAGVGTLLGAINPAWIPSSISARIADLPAYFGLVDVLSLEVTDENFAIVERLAHWVAAIRMWELAPWLGVGPGNYATVYAMVAIPRWIDPLGHAHNIYLNVLGETGIWGFSAFLLMWVSLVGWLIRNIRQNAFHQLWGRALTVGVLGILAHLAVHSVFDNLFVQGMYLHIALWLAVVAISANRRVECE